MGLPKNLKTLAKILDLIATLDETDRGYLLARITGDEPPAKGD